MDIDFDFDLQLLPTYYLHVDITTNSFSDKIVSTVLLSSIKNLFLNCFTIVLFPVKNLFLKRFIILLSLVKNEILIKLLLILLTSWYFKLMKIKSSKILINSVKQLRQNHCFSCYNNGITVVINSLFRFLRSNIFIDIRLRL